MKMPEISIIVAVYKVEAYLSDCVDSILNQTFSDFEVILVDDGSPDNCGAMCEEYAARDPRVIVLHQENQGQSAARNNAMKIARGQWICFVDSDDLPHPRMLELLYRAVKQSDAGMSMCQAVEAVEPPADFLNVEEQQYQIMQIREESLVECFDRGDYPGWVVWGKLIRREIVEGYLFSPGRVYEDNEVGCHWICGAETIARLPQRLYFYRINPAGTTKSSFNLKRLDYLWALEQIIRFYREKGYHKMTERFCGLYAAAAADSYNSTKRTLNRPDLAKNIRKTAWKLVLIDRIPFTGAQRERMMEGMYPKVTIAYWTLRAGFRRLKNDGLTGFFRKLKEQLWKGDKT